MAPSTSGGVFPLRRRLILYVDEHDRWSPATVKPDPDQRGTAKLRIRAVRSGKDRVVDSCRVVAFGVDGFFEWCEQGLPDRRGQDLVM